jgi:hypothetical protein
MITIGTIATGLIVFMLVVLTYIGVACLWEDSKIELAIPILIIMSLLMTALILYLLIGNGWL